MVCSRSSGETIGGVFMPFHQQIHTSRRSSSVLLELIFGFRLSAILSRSNLDHTMLWYGTQSRPKLVLSIPMMLPPNSAAQCFISVLGNSLAQCFIVVLWDNMFIPWYGTQSWQIFVFYLPNLPPNSLAQCFIFFFGNNRFIP
ncbi:hypothetical protein C5167_027966 [Papaver somniferum]|uniref:uncharacterized protein LOC113341064 n=1 Tax=Papaver somniferum TaxID=3469 RepID=UPI000E700D49|nr:uncharacterized protein LOC113341064 [Papaver somniferum]RZC92075.1 hypothetical protein C5167_027966 [Papaver somniferum]